MQVEDNSQIQPSLTRPDVTGVTSPLLVWGISVEVAIQQVWRDIELAVTVYRELVLACSSNRYAVLAHQPTNTTVAQVQTDLLQFFGHAWTAIAS